MKTYTKQELINLGNFIFRDENEIDCVAEYKEFCEGDYIAFVKETEEITESEKTELFRVHFTELPKGLKY
jgi:hypothetical protein